MTSAEDRAGQGAGPVGLDPIAPFAAEAATNKDVSKEQMRVAVGLMEVRERAADMVAQTRLVQRVYVEGFLTDVEEATKLATALASGHLEEVSFDPASLGETW